MVSINGKQHTHYQKSSGGQYTLQMPVVPKMYRGTCIFLHYRNAFLSYGFTALLCGTRASLPWLRPYDFYHSQLYSDPWDFHISSSVTWSVRKVCKTNPSALKVLPPQAVTPQRKACKCRHPSTANPLPQHLNLKPVGEMVTPDL